MGPRKQKKRKKKRRRKHKLQTNSAKKQKNSKEKQTRKKYSDVDVDSALKRWWEQEEMVQTNWGTATLVERCDEGWNIRWCGDEQSWMLAPYQFCKL
jgi:hypothetical protein